MYAELFTDNVLINWGISVKTATTVYKIVLRDAFSYCDTIPACDGRTDGRTKLFYQLRAMYS